MPDLFDSLRGLGDDVPITPPSDVRRRGDRLRRRRRALQTLGAAAAVAVVATGTTFVLDGDTLGETPLTRVAGEPPGGWRKEIPTGYPLDRGWPEPDGLETKQRGPSQKWAPFTDEGIRPCGEPAYPTAHPVDSVGSTSSNPGGGSQREMTLYADARAAVEVTRTLVSAWEACPSERVPDPPFEYLTEVRPERLGDAAWAVTHGAHQFPGLSVYYVVRVGNAVLITADGGHATLENAPQQLAEQRRQVAPLVAEMCIFALDPCRTAPDEGGQVSGKLPALDEDALLTDEELAGEVPAAWREIADREDPTLDCQADWLNQLKAEKGAFREWQAPNAEAATAVLEYPDVPSAEAAYETVRWWVASCDDRLPGVRRLEHDELGQDFDYSTGPTYVRRVTADGDSGRRWVDDQAVALTGSRIVLLSVATLTEEEVDPRPFHNVLAFASTRAIAPLILGPKGYGDLELGMSAEDAEATGLVRVFPGEGCRGLQLTSSPVTKSAVDGYVSDTYGLAALYGGITPERIAVGSTLDELKARYPHARQDPNGWYADVDDEPHSTYYFGVEDGKVVSVSLQLKEQDCVS